MGISEQGGEDADQETDTVTVEFKVSKKAKNRKAWDWTIYWENYSNVLVQDGKKIIATLLYMQRIVHEWLNLQFTGSGTGGKYMNQLALSLHTSVTYVQASKLC